MASVPSLTVEQLIEAFHHTHEREYSRHFNDKDVELVNIRVIGVGRKV